MNKYTVDVCEGTAYIEIFADAAFSVEGKLTFVRDHIEVAEFMMWRYWKCEGPV